VMEGALLRLRPKLMTVSTVVAGLLPIMCSTSAGSEVMKPLAMRVLGRDGLKSSARVNCHAGDLLTATHRRRSKFANEDGAETSESEGSALEEIPR